MNLFYIISGLVITFLTGYLTAYFKEKGKNKAQLGDIKKLTEEKEKVTAEFQLDLAKRKYQYESKKEQYFKFFNLLDEWDSDGNKDIKEKFLPIIKKFNRSYSAADNNKAKQKHALNTFSDDVNNMMHDHNLRFLKLKNETKSLKLIASEKTILILQELEDNYDLSFQMATSFIKELANVVVNGKNEETTLKEDQLKYIGKQTAEIKAALVTQVKQELNEI